jgi:hypothetical protein
MVLRSLDATGQVLKQTFYQVLAEAKSYEPVKSHKSSADQRVGLGVSVLGNISLLV